MPKREFALSGPQTVTIVPAVTVSTSNVVVEHYDDNGVTIEATLSFKDGSGRTLFIVLWDAASYPGSAPTLTQIKNRIKSLLNLT
jgi:hypothetical protein